MPNHVTTIIEAPNEVIESMLNDERLVDFAKIIPLPKGLVDDFDGINLRVESLAKQTVGVETQCNDFDEQFESLGEEQKAQYGQMVANYRACGYFHEMDFAREVWGTKWGAYHQEPADQLATRVRFQTAWNHSFSIVEALSNKFPKATIQVQYADEDWGSNCGKYQITNGNVKEAKQSPGWGTMNFEDRKYWWEFAQQVIYGEVVEELTEEDTDDA